MVSREIRRKSYRWHREMIVRGTLWISVVARMKMAWAGGSRGGLQQGLTAGSVELVDLVDDVDLVSPSGACSRPCHAGRECVDAAMLGARPDFAEVRERPS